MADESMPPMTASMAEQDRELARELVEKARTDGLDLVGPGLLDHLRCQLTLRVFVQHRVRRRHGLNRLDHAACFPAKLGSACRARQHLHRSSDRPVEGHNPAQTRARFDAGVGLSADVVCRGGQVCEGYRAGVQGGGWHPRDLLQAQPGGLGKRALQGGCSAAAGVLSGHG